MGMKKAVFSIFTEYRFFMHYGISVFIILLIMPALPRSKKVRNLPVHLLCILLSQYHRHCI